ncbi:MAG: hypothetical protein ABJG78_08780 [Cyclobacteriaceae bacterium]
MKRQKGNSACSQEDSVIWMVPPGFLDFLDRKISIIEKISIHFISDAI